MFSHGVKKIKRSRYFKEICVKIGECKSREEESLIVHGWMSDVKRRLSKPKQKLNELYENVISLIHLTLLGYDTSFGHIHAINLTQDSQIMTKALGYLACMAVFDSDSQLLILIINSTQRDLSSQQPIPMSLALTALCHLITPDLIQPVVGYVGQALTHPVSFIRQKAIMCIHSFIDKDPSSTIDFFPEIMNLLHDPDLSIINSVVLVFSKMLQNQLNIRQIVECLPDIIDTCANIQNGLVNSEYIHQRVFAPFNLINIYRLFQIMAPHVPGIAHQVSQILTSTLQNGITESSASASILYEAIKTCIIVGLFDIPQFMGSVSLFMTSPDQNLKFVGLGLLESIPDFANEFQSIIIDCLEHPDPTIRLRTLGLLHAMACESNSQIIIVNMLRFFQKTKNETIRTELADRITSIASQYAPSSIWFAKTMEQLFSIAGDHIHTEVAFAVMKLIEEKCTDEMRREIMNLYIDVAQSGKKLSDVFVSVIAKLIGEYAELSDEYDLQFVTLLLCDLADAYENSRDWVLTSLLQIISKLDEIPQQVIDTFENYKNSRQIFVQEICYEALVLINFKDSLMVSMEIGEIEEYNQDLAFLDEYVEDSIVNGNIPEYIPIDERETEDLILEPTKAKLKLTNEPQQAKASYVSEYQATSLNEEYHSHEAYDTGLNTIGVAAVWTENGISSAPLEESNGSLNEDNYNISQQVAETDAPGNVFSAFKKNRSNVNTDDARREKIQQSIFGGQKKLNKAQPNLHNQHDVSVPLDSSGVPNVYGAQDIVQFSDDELHQIQEANMLYAQPACEIINQYSTLEPQLVYQDSSISIDAVALNGSVFLAFTNTSQQPIVGLTIDVNGPQILIREISSHPINVGVILPNLTLRYVATFRFPPQIHGFPDFVFNTKLSYNHGDSIEIPLPMNLATFIIPKIVSTPEFGSLWKKGGCEIIYSPETLESITLDDIRDEIVHSIHVQSVQRIRQEEIFIGQLFSTPFNVMIHVKHHTTMIEMKVLTRAQPLTQAVVNLLKQCFEGI